MTGAIFFLAFQLSAAPLSFDEAKALADAYESSLAASSKAALIKVQGDAIGVAFGKCSHLAESPIEPFTVVAHVGETGTTDKTWLKGETALAQCVEQELATAKLPANDGRPFYASYEFTFKP